MTVTPSKRDRRDWTLIIILLPIGMLFMVLAGQLAIRLVPSWSVNGGMGSNLDPETASGQNPGQIQPLSFDILTPMGWLASFLTPGPDSANDGVSFAPFVVFEPSSTPSPVVSPTISNTPPAPTETPTASATSTSTANPTSTKKPPADDPPTSTATATTPAPVCTDPNAINNGGSLPCTYPVPVSSTLTGTPVAATPAGYNDGAPDGNTSGANVANIPDGYYLIINLPTPIIVVGISDTGYDFVYYERQVACSPPTCPSNYGIQMDSVILSISTAVNGTYYTVFNWGYEPGSTSIAPDTNSNVGDVTTSTGTENDNQIIDSTELTGTVPQDTGIQIDVDNAPSHPPADNYSFLAIQAPAAPPNDGNDGADVDSVQVLP
jgi:hypothetical protein